MIEKPLTACFLKPVPQALRETAPWAQDLEPLLTWALSQVRSKHATFSLPDDIFLAFVGARAAQFDNPRRALEQLHLADLYHACACLAGDEAAVRLFETRYFPEIERVVRRRNPATALIDDVKQAVYEKLFLAAAGARPKIHQYQGRGDLLAFVRITATRQLLNMLRTSDRVRQLRPEVFLEEAVKLDDQELEYLKELYKEPFKEAFHAALDGLTSRERNLLRYHLLDTLSIDDIGRLYRVHRATAARWLVRIREKLLVETRKFLSQRLRVEAPQADSIVRLVQSMLDLSLRRRLDEPEPEPEPEPASES